MSQSQKYVTLSLKPDVKKRFRDSVEQIYRRYHPELKHLRLDDSYLLNELIRYYEETE